MATPPIPDKAVTAVMRAWTHAAMCEHPACDRPEHIPASLTGSARDRRAAEIMVGAAAPELRDHWAALLKAEIADEMTAITAETVIEAVADSTARIAELETALREALAAITRDTTWPDRHQVDLWLETLGGAR